MNRNKKPCGCQSHPETDLPGHQPIPAAKEYYYYCTNPGTGQVIGTGVINAEDDADAQTQLNNETVRTSLYCRFDTVS